MKAAIVAALFALMALPSVAQTAAGEIEMANQRFVQALNKGDAAMIAGMYTERALVLPPTADMIGTLVYQISLGALAILLATFTGSMAQYGLLTIPVVTVLDLMSGSTTPMESMPLFWQNVMQFTPTPHFVAFAQGVLYRGAGLDVVWPQLAALAGFTAVFLGSALMRFRKAIMSFQ